MSTNAPFPPYEMVADDGSFEGIDVEVAHAIAEKLGLELVVDDMDFDAALTGRPDRQERHRHGRHHRRLRTGWRSWTSPTAMPPACRWSSSRRTPTCQSIDDLEGKHDRLPARPPPATSTASDTPENGGYGEENVTAYDNGATAVQALLNGQVDCGGHRQRSPAQEYVNANEGLKILDTEFVDEEYAIGVAKGNTALLDAINAALEELTADGTVPVHHRQVYHRRIRGKYARNGAAARMSSFEQKGACA